MAVGLLLLTAGRFLRCLERVDLGFDALEVDLLVGGEVAQATFPLLLGGRGDRANLANRSLDNAIAALAFVDYLLAAVAFKNTTFFGPEGALGTGKNGLTLHGLGLLAVCVFSGINETYNRLWLFCQRFFQKYSRHEPR